MRGSCWAFFPVTVMTGQLLGFFPVTAMHDATVAGFFSGHCFVQMILLRESELCSSKRHSGIKDKKFFLYKTAHFCEKDKFLSITKNILKLVSLYFILNIHE